MKKVLLVGKSLAEGGEFGSAELMKNTLSGRGNKGIQFFSTRFEDLVFNISSKQTSIYDTKNDKKVDEYDFIFLRDWFVHAKEQALALAMYLDEKDIPFANREALINRSSSKLTQYMYIGLQGMPIPRTVYAGHENLIGAVDEFDWPIILKERGGRRGSHNFLINNQRELEDTLKNHKDIKFLIQEFIPNDHDLRVIFFKDTVYLVMKRARTSDDTHLNNTSQGATAELLEVDYLPQSLNKEMQTISKRFGRDFTGIDLIYNPDTREHYYLEVNNMPQMETGSFVDEKLAVFEEIVKRETR